jgi:hypothetical protein
MKREQSNDSLSCLRSASGDANQVRRANFEDLILIRLILSNRDQR